jgi:hypothetical protein
MKVFPIIKEWKFYNKLCELGSSRFNLFFLKRKAFKSFTKESKQDLYSGKVLLNKAFLLTRSEINAFTYSSYSHLIFCSKPPFNIKAKLNSCICIHCGMSVILFS